MRAPLAYVALHANNRPVGLITPRDVFGRAVPPPAVPSHLLPQVNKHNAELATRAREFEVAHVELTSNVQVLHTPLCVVVVRWRTAHSLTCATAWRAL